MRKHYTFFALAISALFLVSFSANPPDGKTGAPGDSLCAECHSQNNTTLGGEISVEGFPSTITPGEIYQLTVVNRNTVGDAVKGGFQMTILGPFNTRAGTMSTPSQSSSLAIANNRQYFEHNPAQTYPDSNVLRWTVNWTAPEMTGGSVITWYVAGNIANGNSQDTGDRVVTANGNGTIVLSAVDDLTLQEPTLYPNPGNDHINIVMPDGTLPDGTGVFYSLTGNHVGESQLQNGKMITPDLPSGVYLIEIRQDDRSQIVRWFKI